MKTLRDLQTEIHAENKNRGWWNEERSVETFVCLFHSELSEAMEGLRKNLNDDHLPHHKMFWVELGDFCLRCFDYLGSIDYNDEDYNNFDVDRLKDCYFKLIGINADSEIDLLAYSHQLVTDFYVIDDYESLAVAVVHILIYAHSKDVDLLKIMEEKRIYNGTRADHKLENRAAECGKKF